MAELLYYVSRVLLLTKAQFLGRHCGKSSGYMRNCWLRGGEIDAARTLRDSGLSASATSIEPLLRQRGNATPSPSPYGDLASP